MDTKPVDLTQKDISELFGFSGLTESEQADMLSEIGSVVMESALLRLVSGMEEKDVEKLNTITEMESEPEKMIEKLLSTFPEFNLLLEEEANAFRTEAVKVLENKESAQPA